MERALKVEPAPGDPEFLSNFTKIVSFTFFYNETMYTNYKIFRLYYMNKKRFHIYRGEALEY